MAEDGEKGDIEKGLEKLEEMTEPIKGIKNPILSKIVNYIVVSFVALFVGGVGGGSFMADSIERKYVDYMVTVLDSVGIQPLPKGLLGMMSDAVQTKEDYDSTLTFLKNYVEYQQDINTIFLSRFDTVHIGGHVFYDDPVAGVWWTVQDGYIYQAVKQRNEFWYFPFEWQIDEGGDNHVQIAK